MVIEQIHGRNQITHNLSAQYQFQPSIYQSCSAVFQGTYFIFGGSVASRQILAVSGGSIVYLGELPFDLQKGTCGTFNMNFLPTIFLCFGFAEENTCRLLKPKNDELVTDFKVFNFFELFEITSLSYTINSHGSTTLANYKGYPLAFGGISNNKLEIFDIKNTKWMEIEDSSYTSAHIIFDYSVISTSNGVIYMGGNIGPSDDFSIQVNSVDEYKNGKWARIGLLREPRYGHKSIMSEDWIYIVGGSIKNAEIYNIQDGDDRYIGLFDQDYDYMWGALLQFNFNSC